MRPNAFVQLQTHKSHVILSSFYQFIIHNYFTTSDMMLRTLRGW